MKDARGTPIAEEVSGPGSRAPHHVNAGTTSVAATPGPEGGEKREVPWDSPAQSPEEAARYTSSISEMVKAPGHLKILPDARN